jgi:urease accessory protein
VKTRSRIGASLAGGRTRLDCIRSAAPIHVRQTPDGVYLVGGAAGPLGGDDLLLEIEVASGATLVVRSAAASLALPGSRRGPSTVTVHARVAPGGTLYWLPEPVIAGGGCDHRIFNRIDLAPGATVVWRDELVLGRGDEEPGRMESRIDATIAGRPLLRNLLTVGPGTPGWDGPAVIGSAGAAGSMLAAGPGLPAGPFPVAALGGSASILALAGPGALACALAPDSLKLRELLDRALEMMTSPVPEA